jgi:SAM-dependent methyltransferase
MKLYKYFRSRPWVKSLISNLPPINQLYAHRTALLKKNKALKRQIATLQQEGSEKNKPTAETLIRPAPPTVDPLAIPIIINNFNQLSHIRQQLTWLLGAGHTNILILDNCSTYKPLLKYYSTLPDRIKVVLLEKNYGKTALWDANIIGRLNVNGPFVYTDSDVIPDGKCTKDLVAHLQSILRAFPQVHKVGPGLKINDLPERYKFKEEVQIWERQFWRRPVARGVFLAPIDTTFALYRSGSAFMQEPALRTGWPYLARHQPWYADSNSPSEEEQFYATMAKKTNWTLGVLPGWLAKNIRNMQSSTSPKLLHLGCGNELIPGWINVDIESNVGADIVYDLNKCATEKLPIENDSIDGFFMCHVFEHIVNTLQMMEELYRVAKPGAKFIIRLPHGASDDALEDPTHRRPCFPNSFVYFAQPAYSRVDYGYLGDWRLERVKLVVDSHFLQSEGQTRVLDLVKTRRNIVREMIVELSAVKPMRPRELRLLQWAEPIASGTPLDEETTF